VLTANGFFTRFIVYSCLHSHFYTLEQALQLTFVVYRTLPYHSHIPEGIYESVASVYRLAPNIFGAELLDQ
jgi:hypothetical protein